MKFQAISNVTQADLSFSGKLFLTPSAFRIKAFEMERFLRLKPTETYISPHQFR
jgi:hypothetical protein